MKALFQYYLTKKMYNIKFHLKPTCAYLVPEGQKLCRNKLTLFESPRGTERIEHFLTWQAMATNNTYTQLYIHFVFAVKYRLALISEKWDERLRLYMTAIVQNNGHKMIAINNMPDHIHLFVGLNPKQAIADLMRVLKSDSSEWINKENLTIGKFQWQDGYGAFSHSKPEVDKVVKYILNQKEHHKEKTFITEYRQLLKRFGIPYDEQYIFKLPE